MDKRKLPHLPKKLNWGALQIAVLYLFLGGLWILFSDKTAEAITRDPEVLTAISLYKGWGYVLVTALLLYWLIQRNMAEIHASRTQLQQVIDALPVLISYVDRDGQYRLKNKTYEDWFGDTTRGGTPEETAGKEAYQTVSKYVDKVLQGETVTFESATDFLSGEHFIHATYIPDKAEDGHVKGFFALVEDISERKRTEEENKSLARFPNENPNPVLRASYEGKIIYANAASEFLLQDWHCQVGDDLPPDWITLIKESISSGKRKILDVQLDKTIYSFIVAPIPDANYVNLYGRDITERKQAEFALLESSLRFRTLFEASPDANLLIDPQGNWPIIDCNTAACHMNGYTHEELLGQSIDILNPNPWQPAKREEYLANIREAGVLRYETLHRRKDGTEFPIEVSTSLISLDGHEMLLGIDRDITERKRAEENLRRFELLSEHSRDIILFIKREDGRILNANAAAIQAYGYSRDELLALTVQDLRGADHDLAADQMAQADAEGILFETIHLRKDGTAFPVEVSSRGAAIDGVRTLISIVRDNTERKRAEHALRESQVRLNFALEKSHAGGWDLDLVDHTALRTREHDRIFGYEALLPEWTYELFLEHVLPEDRAEVNRLFQEAITTQTDWSFECRIRRKDGQVRWIWATGGHLFDEAGHAHRMAGIVQDITERKEAENEIHRLNEELEQRVIERTAQLEIANKELEAFSYSVSHDLRAPLRAIDGYTRILVEDYEAKLDAEGTRICGVISAEARRMGQLIDDLLSFSRLSRKEMYSSKVDMKALATYVFDELMKGENRDRIDFQITRLPAVNADPSLIRQVWVNLLSNAIKFTSRKERAIIKVGTKQSREEYIFYVHDTGAGFDMEYVDKLFGVFQRLHGESEFEGTGVGLAIVQRIIRRHGGRVWAEGELEKGATFYFALPRKEESS